MKFYDFLLLKIGDIFYDKTLKKEGYLIAVKDDHLIIKFKGEYYTYIYTKDAATVFLQRLTW